MVVKGGKMSDLIITIDRDTRKVKTNRNFIGLNGENLQGNIIADFTNKAEFVDGTAYIEVVQNGQKYNIEMTKDDTNKLYSLPIQSSLLRYACKLSFQVVIEQAETENGVPVFKSEVFTVPCLEAINAEQSIPEQYPTWCREIEEELNGKASRADLENYYTKAEVGGLVASSINDGIKNAEAYIDEEIAKLVNSAPETLDTLGEIAEALDNNENVVEVLNEAIAKKANAQDLATVATSGSYNDLKDTPTTETWTFTLDDGTTVKKAVVLK